MGNNRESKDEGKKQIDVVRLNKLQRIAEKASQKMVLYLQPEIKKGIRNEINFQDFVLREQG